MVFEWDDENVEHIAEHGVSPDDAEEAFTDRRQFGVDAYNTSAERRWGIVGATDEGRLLVIIYTRRDHAIRVVTARDADLPFQRRYRRQT